MAPVASAPRSRSLTLKGLEAAGIGKTIFMPGQAGRAPRMLFESLELLTAAVLPPFREREMARAPARAAARGAHAEAALARKARRRTLTGDEIPTVSAYGLLPVKPATLPEANRRRLEVYRRMREIIDRTR